MQTKEEMPAQTSYVGRIVDVSRDGARIGTGRITRDDDGPPWCMEVTMLVPPSMRGKVFDCSTVDIKDCRTQQVN